MILILSNSYDTSTTEVIEWLTYNNLKFYRINENDIIKLIFDFNDIFLELSDITISLNEITSFWYRKGNFSYSNNYNFSNNNDINLMQKMELLNIMDFINYKLSKISHINRIDKRSVNRLIVSDIAKNIGLKTPEEYIISKISRDSKINKKLITKTISGNSLIDYNDTLIFAYSTLIDLTKINEENFFPSLIQEYIEKKIELRIFYLNESFYTMAILSQNDEQTKIDFRNYNNTKPNRKLPFKLPLEVEIKLDLLMKKLEINCGSIDMILTPENDYVFLEINPVGQFGMVSYPCNYKLEKKIAEALL